MRIPGAPPLLIALLIAACCLSLRADEDVDALYMSVFSEYRTAERLEADGKSDDALTKYRYCVSLLEQISQKYPSYSPVVVDFRLGKSREAVARVQASMSAGSKLPPLPQSLAPDQPPVSQPPVSQPPAQPASRIATFQLPIPGISQPPSEAASSYTGDEAAIGRGASAQLQREIQILRGRVQESQEAITQLNQQLLQKEAEKQNAYRELDLTKVQVVELKSRLAQAGQKLDDLEAANKSLAQEKEVDAQRLADLEHELEAAKADLDVANEYNDELFAKLEAASSYIDKSEQIRSQLLTERKELVAEVDQKSGDKELRGQLDKAIAENNDFKRKIAGIPDLEKRNADLEKKLTETEERANALAVDKEQSRKIEEGLRKEVETLNSSIASMQGEIKSGHDRVAELEKQFEETSAATASATGAMASENALLRQIVERELKDQSKRQQARKLVMEEMEKLKVRSSTLIDRLDALGGAETSLTPDEQKILRKPQTVASMSASGNSFEVVAGKNEADLPADLAMKAQAADEASENSQYEKARDIYREIAQRAPGNFMAAVNLGLMNHHLEDYSGAINSFERALEIKPGEPFALTNLGISEFRSGDVETAQDTLKRAVAADDSSYIAHYFLGLAFRENGDSKAAMAEVRRSIELNPNYRPALDLEQDLQAVAAPSTTAGANSSR